ncbi:hypothetical protein SB782_36675, partial [Brevibacillus sp. SIMBA_076]
RLAGADGATGRDHGPHGSVGGSRAHFGKGDARYRRRRRDGADALVREGEPVLTNERPHTARSSVLSGRIGGAGAPVTRVHRV